MDPFAVARLYVEDMLQEPTSLALKSKVLGHLRARDLPSLCALGQFQDSEYQSPGAVWEVLVLRQVASFFKKNEAFSNDILCTEAAHKAFLKAELKCRITNRRLDHYFIHRDRIPSDINSVLTRMEREIALLLGDPHDFIKDLPSKIRLTDGASEDRTRKRSYPFLKVTGKLRAPAGAEPWLKALLQFYGVEPQACRFTAVHHNVVTTVPKNWKTHRLIAKEPTHSIPFQLALDNFLKGKLRKWRVDLSDQSANQELAREGSIDGSFATLDLAMASDTLSYNTVAWMLPNEWLRVFDTFRSSHYKAPWGTGKYSKYSSMGNGYTFTLETLIFTAIVRACGANRYAVYGDDLVVPVEIAQKVADVLRFLGFGLNSEKSYSDARSRFRESCGMDYYKGELITPFYLRELPMWEEKAGVAHNLNGLISIGAPQGRLWEWAAKAVRDHRLRLVPWNEDTRSGVFITPHHAWKTKKLWMDQKLGSGGINHNYGFPVFNGYGPRQATRNTRGWRSLFLWFLRKGIPPETECRAGSSANRRSIMLLGKREVRDEEGRFIQTSIVGLGCRYVHRTRRFFPLIAKTPHHLFLWDEVVGTGSPRKAGAGSQAPIV